MKSFYQQIQKTEGLPFNLVVFDSQSDPNLHIYPKHWHEHLEMTVTLKGKGIAWIDGETFSIQDHNIFIINPKSLHYVHGIAPYHSTYGYSLQIDLAYFEPFFSDIIKQYYPTCSSEITDAIIQAVVQLHQMILRKEDRFNLLCQLIQILKILNQQKSDAQDTIRSQKHKDRILAILNFIQDHYTEPLDIALLADEFHLSKGYLQKCFKEDFGQSVHSYILEIRMMHAIDDLKYTDLSILNIALKNGFPNVKSMIQAFKKQFSQTPGTFRKKMINRPQTDD